MQLTPSSPGAALVSVSCASPTVCTAVGNINEELGMLAERWNGQRWSIQPTPPPIGTLLELLGVSCPSPTVCTAVGWQAPPSEMGPVLPLVERWTGSAPPPPSPPPPPPVSNRFTVLHVRTLANGEVRRRISVPGPGGIAVVETTCRKTAPGGCSATSGRMVFGRTDVQANRARALSATITPNRQGRRLIQHQTSPTTVRVAITFTPTGGQPRTVVLPRIHLPVVCSDPDHDNDCDTPPG
jgi:hypothetical protein